MINPIYIWQVEPNWNDGITETLEWKTDVLQSYSGAEQRVAKRYSPRRTFEFSLLLGNKTAQQFEHWLFFVGGSEIYLPLFNDVYQLENNVIAGATILPISTHGRDIHQGTYLLIKSGFDYSKLVVVQVDSVNVDSVTLSAAITSDIAAGAFIYPLRKAVLTDQPTLNRDSDSVISSQIRLRINEYNQYDDLIDFLPVYRNQPVLNLIPDWSEPLTAQYERLLLEFDNGDGLPARMDTARRAFCITNLQYCAIGRALQHQFRSIFYYLRGRQKPIWLPSFNHDLTPVNGIVNTFLDINYIGFSIAGAVNGRQDICITLTNGEQLYKRIIGAVVIDENTERFILDGEAITINQHDILMISFMNLSRLNNDSVQFEHITDADGVATISINFWGLRDELE